MSVTSAEQPHAGKPRMEIAALLGVSPSSLGSLVSNGEPTSPKRAHHLYERPAYDVPSYLYEYSVPVLVLVCIVTTHTVGHFKIWDLL
jgi:hypothetical protein